jgi:hypothetical protein
MFLHAARVRRARVAPLLFVALALAHDARASDPFSPLQVIDSGQDFRFEVALQVAPNAVTARRVYNRIAGTLVGANTVSARGVPVTRALDLERDAQERWLVDLDPAAQGQPLPDGVYSAWLELHSIPGPEARSSVPCRERHAFFFRVLGGAAQRLTLSAYSALVDPPTQRLNKLRLPEPVHVGTVTPKLRASSYTAALQLESGAPYAVPSNEENE